MQNKIKHKYQNQLQSDLAKIVQTLLVLDSTLLKVLKRGSILLSVLSLMVTIYLFGVTNKVEIPYEVQTFPYWAFPYFAFFLFYEFSYNLRHRIEDNRKLHTIFTALLFTTISLIYHIDSFYEYFIQEFRYLWLGIASYAALNFVAIGILSKHFSNWLKSTLKPAQIFAGSFAMIIFGGAFLLMIPSATHFPIAFIDALFTSTSAVCVTGLTTIDVSAIFTDRGMFVIVLLIQIGGLGVITLTSFFAYIFVGKSSLGQDMMVKDYLSEDNFSEVISLLKNIVLTTLFFEGIGTLFIFNSIEGNSWADLKFAVFHAISAFCNAGFSSNSDGLFNAALRYNYSLQWIIALLIIFGGIGFPFLKNLEEYAKLKIEYAYQRIVNRRVPTHRRSVISINTRLAFTTTFWLLFIGTVLFMIVEWNGILEPHSGWGKMTTAFFMATTPRTAGFSTVPMGELAQLSILLTIILMWIGASPVSAGGGVKTTTFGLLVHASLNIIRGNRNVEMYGREIDPGSIYKAIALITFSFFSISIGVFLLVLFDPQVPLSSAVFECVSAISTVGLSLDITPTLSLGSKYVLIGLMFVGRVGLLVLFSFFAKERDANAYRLPRQRIMF